MTTILARSVSIGAAATLVGLQVLSSAPADAAANGGHTTFTTTNPCALQTIHVLTPPTASPGGRVVPTGPIKANPTPTPAPSPLCFAIDVQIVPNVGHGYAPAKCRGPSPADISFSSNRGAAFYHGMTGADCWIHGSLQVPFGSTIYIWTTDPDCGAVGPYEIPMPTNRTGSHPGTWDPSTGHLELPINPFCP